jgi:monoamine oxidase
LREPVGRIHWAGAERATEMHGLMEGTVRPGERAADEVVDLDRK